MTFNKRTRTVSGRIDHTAYDVLKWHAALTGYGVSTEIRDYLHMRAEQITRENPDLNPDRVKPRSAADIVIPSHDELIGATDTDPIDAPPAPGPGQVRRFAEELGAALHIDPDATVAVAVYDTTEGVVRATLDGQTYVSTPTPPEE